MPTMTPTMTEDQLIKYEQLERQRKEKAAIDELKKLASQHKAAIDAQRDSDATMAHIEALKEELTVADKQEKKIDLINTLAEQWKNKVKKEEAAERGFLNHAHPDSKTLQFVRTLRTRLKTNFEIKTTLTHFLDITAQLDAINTKFNALSIKEKNELLSVKGSQRETLLIAAIANKHSLADAILQYLNEMTADDTALYLFARTTSGISPLIAAVLMQDVNATKQILTLIAKLDSRLQKIALSHAISHDNIYFNSTEGKQIQHPLCHAITGKSVEAIAASVGNQAIIDAITAFKMPAKSQAETVKTDDNSSPLSVVPPTVSAPALQTHSQSREELSSASRNEDTESPTKRSQTAVFFGRNEPTPVHPAVNIIEHDATDKTRLERIESLKKEIDEIREPIARKQFGTVGGKPNHELAALDAALAFLDNLGQTTYDNFLAALTRLSQKEKDKHNALFLKTHYEATLKQIDGSAAAYNQMVPQERQRVKPSPFACLSCLSVFGGRKATRTNTAVHFVSLNDDGTASTVTASRF